MISLPLPHLLLFVLALNLLLVFLVSAYYSARRRSPLKGRKTPRIYRCGTCGHVYVDPRDIPLAECARCGTMNEAVRR